MKSLWVMFKIEFKLAIREFSGVLFGIIFPVGLMLLLGTLLDYTMLQQSFAAVITIGILASGLMGIPLTLSSYREKKILKRFKVTPTSPFKLLVAQGLTQFVFALISSILVYLIAVLLFDYQMPGSFLLFVMVYLLLVVTIYSIGMVIASISNSVKTANLLATLIYFPMLFLSGATVPYEIMPKGLQLFSDFLPLTQGIKVLKAASLGFDLSQYILQFVILSVTTIICAILSIKYFRYEY